MAVDLTSKNQHVAVAIVSAAERWLQGLVSDNRVCGCFGGPISRNTFWGRSNINAQNRSKVRGWATIVTGLAACRKGDNWELDWALSYKETITVECASQSEASFGENSESFVLVESRGSACVLYIWHVYKHLWRIAVVIRQLEFEKAVWINNRSIEEAVTAEMFASSGLKRESRWSDLSILG